LEHLNEEKSEYFKKKIWKIIHLMAGNYGGIILKTLKSFCFPEKLDEVCDKVEKQIKPRAN